MLQCGQALYCIYYTSTVLQDDIDKKGEGGVNKRLMGDQHEWPSQAELERIDPVGMWIDYLLEVQAIYSSITIILLLPSICL